MNYVYVCVGCGLFDCADRGDRLTCSNQCRVRAHRNGSMQVLRALAERYEVRPEMIQQSAAVQLLAPEIGAQIMAGTISHLDAQRAIWPMFHSLLTKQIEGNVS